MQIQATQADSPRFTRSLAALGTPAFEPLLQEEIEHLGSAHLPLQQGLCQGSLALEEGLRAVIHGVESDATRVRVTAGIFYHSLLAGCSCADDPTPQDRLQEHCLVLVEIDRASALARVHLLED